MFTGIISEIGEICELEEGANARRFLISCREIGAGLKIGDSIAVNGVCLTATSLPSGGFTCDVMHESLQRSNLGDLRIGNKVNLERPLLANGRFDGHIVLGHVDGVAQLLSRQTDGIAQIYKFAAAPQLLRYIVEKGSIALNGISLTVSAVDESTFSVAVIPHTLAHTNLPEVPLGGGVNVECDVLGKYVEKMLHATPNDTAHSQVDEEIDAEFLAKNGF
ncbi:riboflavin synthase [uncultured Arcanobacterium sp.]|uniref:riboflavin synthase n=1 Tax=uncultured Arcanobacterium sp. TaxID=487520 RepID=UPI0026211858|nr:riboflavin synthase [uncultured Arcanobacterium sp.]